jgi:hypothetical protein
MVKCCIEKYQFSNRIWQTRTNSTCLDAIGERYHWTDGQLIFLHWN